VTDIKDTFRDVMGFELPVATSGKAERITATGEATRPERVKEIELPKDITYGTRTGRWPAAIAGARMNRRLRSHTVYPQKWMVVTGGLSMGFKFYGPFENAAKANLWADANLKDGDLYRIYTLNEVRDA